MNPGTSAGDAQERYAAERRQGQTIVADNLVAAWGWASPAGALRASRRADFLIDQAGLGPGVACLELGAGTGEFTQRLAESGCTLMAVELSEATADVCRNRVGDRAKVVVGNVETGEGMGDTPFDAVVGVSVLHHVNVELCLENTLIPRLRRGGRFAFSEPNMANPQVWAERNIETIRRRRHTTPHETAFHAKELRTILADAGLMVEVCEPYEFLHPSTPRALIGAVVALERRLEATRLRGIAGSIRVAGHRP